MNKKNEFALFLENWLASKPFGTVFHEAISYVLNNRGKMLRPNLVLNIAEDLNQLNNNHYWFALSLELHHNYTLVHDDLPCMDNDDIRRGKPTLHKVYGEAHALLVGDILLAQSYSVLSHINVKEKELISKIYHYACGPRGLILGQHLDLMQSHQTCDTRSILRMYELKTARLFQLALVGSMLLTSFQDDLNKIKQLIRLGSICGILFQLLDDFQDWKVDKKSDFNFFQLYSSDAKEELKKYQDKFEQSKLELLTTFPKTLQYLNQFLH